MSGDNYPRKALPGFESMVQLAKSLDEASKSIQAFTESAHSVLSESYPKYTEREMKEKLHEIEQLKIMLNRHNKLFEGIVVAINPRVDIAIDELCIVLPTGFKFAESTESNIFSKNKKSATLNIIRRED